MARNEAKIRFTAETGEFTSQIKQANSTLATLRAGLSLNEAQFKNTGDAAEYLKNKHDLLEKEIKANKDKQEALNDKLEVAKRIYGENSDEAQKWERELTKARTEEQKLISALDQCDKELEENAKGMDDLEEETKEEAKATKDANEGWTAAKQILADLATKALTAVINKMKEAAKEVIKLGTEFTASMSNVAALSGASAKELGNLEAVAKDLGRTTIFSAKDVADAFGYMSLAGWDTTQMMEGIDGVLNLAASSGMDLAKASDMVTDYLTAFGLEASDAAQMVDMLAYAQANSNTTTEQLGQAFGNSAAQMHTAGQSMETTTAILEAFANQGMKGSEAGTALSAMVRDITQKMKDGKIMIGDTAVTVQDANGNFRDLTDILADVEAATDGMGTAEKSAALMTTFTARSVKGVSMALTEGSDKIKGYKENLEDCTGTAEEMTHVMNDNLAGDMKALNSAAEGLGLALFEYFEGPLRGAAKIATDAINKITDAITPQKSVLDSFIDDIEASNNAVRESIQNAQAIMDGALSDVSDLEYYKNLLIELNSQTELTEFEQYQLKDAVEQLSGTIPELSANFDETNGTLNLTNQELENLFNNAKSVAMQTALIEAQKDSYKALAEAELAVARAESAHSQALEEKNDAFAEATDATTILSKTQHDATLREREAADAEKEAIALREEAKAQIELENKAYEDLRKEYGLDAESIDELSEAKKEEAKATEEATEAGEGFVEMTEEEIEAAEEAKKKIVEAYQQMRDSIRDSMRSSVSFMDEFSGGASVTAEEIKKNLDSQIAGIQNWKNNMVLLAQQAGNGMSQEMYDALVEMGPSSANLVQELVDTLQEDTPLFAEICREWSNAMELSDSADMLASYTQAGKDAAEMTAEGIEEGSGEIKSAAKEATAEAADEADFSEIGKKAEDVKDDVKAGLNQSVLVTMAQTALMKTAAKNGAEQTKEAVKDGMSGVPAEVKSTMDQAVSNVQSGVAQMRSALNTTLRGPDIQVPHFSMTGSFDAKTNSVPTVSVSWWAKGGVFKRPTIMPAYNGVGEAGPEAVAPIDVLQDYIQEAVENTGTINPVNVYMTVDGARDPAEWAIEFSREFLMDMRTAYG